MTRLSLLAILAVGVDAFGVLSYHRRYATFRAPNQLFLSEDPQIDTEAELSKEQVERQIGNLVADDEWMGLTMELTELVRVAIIEDVKKNAREFTGKDEYKVGTCVYKHDLNHNDFFLNIRRNQRFCLLFTPRQVIFRRSSMFGSRSKLRCCAAKMNVSTTWRLLRNILLSTFAHVISYILLQMNLET